MHGAIVSKHQRKEMNEEDTRLKKYGMCAIGFAAALSLFAARGVSAQAVEPAAPVYGFVRTEQGVIWMNGDGTCASDCWLEIGDMKFHMDKDGYVQMGLTEVDGKTYYLYYNGTMATGWLTIDGDLYFFGSDGVMAQDTVIGIYQFGNDGKLIAVTEEADAEPKEKSPLELTVDTILAGIITPGMTEEQKIAACYQYVVNTYTYRRTYEKPAGDWTGAFAMEIMTSGQGNCYRYAAAFAYLLKGLGYETKVITGQIGRRGGGLAPHGWTEVLIGDSWYVFDTEMQYANGKKNYYWHTYNSYPSKPLIKQAEWAVHF